MTASGASVDGSCSAVVVVETEAALEDSLDTCVDVSVSTIGADGSSVVSGSSGLDVVEECVVSEGSSSVVADVVDEVNSMAAVDETWTGASVDTSDGSVEAASVGVGPSVT